MTLLSQRVAVVDTTLGPAQYGGGGGGGYIKQG